MMPLAFGKTGKPPAEPPALTARAPNHLPLLCARAPVPERAVLACWGHSLLPAEEKSPPLFPPDAAFLQARGSA